ASSERNTGEGFANFVRGKDWPIQLASELLCDRSFSCADPAHYDQEQRLGTGYGIAQSQTKITRRLFLVLLRICRFFLHRLNAFHLPAHENPVAHVETRDLYHSRVMDLACSISKEQIPQLA